MNKLRIIIIEIAFVGALLTACSDRERCAQTMAEADSLLDAELPDSAFNLLNGIRNDADGLPHNDQMRYYYLLGRAYYDKGETPMAMHYFHHASDCADTTSTDCDLHTLSRIHGQLAQIFLEQDAPENALKQLQIANQIAKKDHDTVMYIATISHKADALEILNLPDSAIRIRQESSRLYQEYGNSQYAAMALGPVIDLLLDKGDYSLAKEYMDQYEKHSGMFDEMGNIREGYEIYYYDKSLYYLGMQQLDSADYYARRILISKELSDQEAAYKALYLIYNKKGQKDSLAKYAMLAYATNDSVHRELSTNNYQRMQALYNYTRHQQLADESQKRAGHFQMGLAVAACIILLLTILLLTGWYLYTQKKKDQQRLREDYAHLQQEKIELQELMRKSNNEHSVLIEERQATIAALEDKIQKQDNKRLYKNLTTIDNALQSDPITGIFEKKANGTGGNITFDEWAHLTNLINRVIPDFLPTLKEACPAISVTEQYLCMLTRLRFGSTQIANLINTDTSNVSKMKARLLPKIFKDAQGGAKEFSQRILEIY